MAYGNGFLGDAGHCRHLLVLVLRSVLEWVLRIGVGIRNISIGIDMGMESCAGFAVDIDIGRVLVAFLEPSLSISGAKTENQTAFC